MNQTKQVINDYYRSGGSIPNLSSGHTLLNATVAELELLQEYAAKELDKRQADYDQAVRFRPSYAPKGVPTASEQKAKIMIHQTSQMIEAIEAAISLIE